MCGLPRECQRRTGSDSREPSGSPRRRKHVARLEQLVAFNWDWAAATTAVKRAAELDGGPWTAFATAHLASALGDMVPCAPAVPSVPEPRARSHGMRGAL